MIIPESGGNVSISEIHENTSQELIKITSDRLKLILLQYISQIENNKSWQMPLSLLSTIILVFCSAEFKPAFGLSKDTWSAIFTMSGGACAIWLLVCLVKIKKSIEVDDVIDIIKNKNSR